MKLELPDNNASVLFHMGNALQSIARDLDLERVDKLASHIHKVTHTETIGDVSSTVTVEPTTTMFKGVDSVDAGTDADDSDPVIEANDTIDADGLPWDQRIHSRGKTRLADNTWRMARKPNDKTDEEWVEYVEGVKAELKALMAIPVATGADLDVLAETPVITAEQRAELKVHVDYAEDPNEVDPFAIDPPVVEAPEVVTPPVVDAVVTPPVVEAPEVVTPPVVEAPEVVTPPVVEAPEVVTPPVVDAVVTPPVVDAVVTPPVVDAVVTPPVVDAVVTPPVVDAVVTPPPADFGALMRFITSNKAKLTSPVVDETLKAQGLASIALLAARTDLIPQVHAALVKLL